MPAAPHAKPNQAFAKAATTGLDKAQDTAPPLVLPMLAGPTASGKSAAAMHLAQKFGLELVSADSMQVYVGMDIGTAKPTVEERAQVPHHMLDVVLPSQAFSVADYVRQAEAAIASVVAQGTTVLIVGGTGFYLRGLIAGLPTVPPADFRAQAPLWQQVEAGNLAALVSELQEAAPKDADRAAGNPRRVVRSLEVLRATGKPPSEFATLPPRFCYSLVALDPPAQALAPRIEQRACKMFDLGLVNEVKALLQQYPSQPTALQAIGYKEVAAHLYGQISEEQALQQVIDGSRRYAKRQRTWFRGEGAARLLPGFGEDNYGELEAWIAALLR